MVGSLPRAPTVARWVAVVMCMPAIGSMPGMVLPDCISRNGNFGELIR